MFKLWIICLAYLFTPLTTLTRTLTGLLPQNFQVTLQPLVQVGGKEHGHCIPFLS